MNLFKDWVVAWSDDQKNYLILRLKDIDQSFSKKYEHYLDFGADSPVKDYFEPGIPAELDLSSDKNSTASEPVDINVSENEEAVNLDHYKTDDDLCKPIEVGSLSPIIEDVSGQGGESD